MKRQVLVASAALAALVLFTVSAQAGPVYNFKCITNTNATQCAIGEAQLTVEVLGPGSYNPLHAPSGGFNIAATQAGFLFRNQGQQPASLTGIYFEDGALLSMANIVNPVAPLVVAFSQGASPPNLPGHNNVSPPFQATTNFTADSDPPAEPNGVNPGEWVAIIFNLETSKTFNDVLTALGLGFSNPNPGGNTSLRIGIHVQAIGAGTPGLGGSEAFILVPEPGFYGLLGLGLAGLLLAARRRRVA